MSRCKLGDGGGDDAGMYREGAFDGIDRVAIIGCLAGECCGVGDGDILCANLLPHDVARG